MTAATVLVVDDDRAIVAVLREVLEDEGYQVITTQSREAVALARDRQPNLILLDIMMPDVDGVELSRRLRAEPATKHIPLVVMSASTTLKRMAGEMPINGILAKPFSIDTVYSVVAQWVKS